MLTAAQQATLKAHLSTNTNTVIVGGTAFAINSNDVLLSDHSGAASPEASAKVAAWYNALTSPAYFTVRTDAPTVNIRNAIVGAAYTPADAPTAGNAAQATAASNYCMAKQQNLAMLGIFPGSGVTTFDASKSLNTATLKDATTQLPSLANFANQTGGWNNIIPLLQHVATVAEKLFSLASTINPLRNAASARGTQYDGTNGNPDVPDVDADGKPILTLTSTDIVDAWKS